MLFSSKRSDGKRVHSNDPVFAVMPFIMRGRNESAVYYKRTIPVEAMQKMVVDFRRKGIRITVFNIIVAALMQTCYRRPALNRFVAGRRLYEHHHFEAAYVVKQSMTDDGVESVAKIRVDENDTVLTIADRMRASNTDIQQEKEKEDDRLIRFFAKMPSFMIRFSATVLRFLDFYGYLPRSLQNILPFFSSVFISHLGSLGADAPFHHLYEFGTNSIFLTIGRVYDAPYKADDGGVEWKKSIDLAFTVDERICDGFYLIKSLKLLEQFLLKPELLLHPAKDALDAYRKYRPEQEELAEGDASSESK